MECANCGVDNQNRPLVLDDHQLHYSFCETCEALWLPGQEADVVGLAALEADTSGSQMACPKCQSLFLDRVLAHSEQQVMTYQCRNCHGLHVEGKGHILSHGVPENHPLASFLTGVGLMLHHRRKLRRKNQLPAAFTIDNARETEFKCPHCDTPLTKYRVSDRTHPVGSDFEICDSCFGIWLDKDDQKNQLDRPESPLEVNFEAIFPSRRTCPKCRDINLISLQFLSPDTEIDCCPTCFGTWLDGGELQEFCDYLGADDQSVIDALVDNAVFQHPALCKLLGHFSQTLYALDSRLQEQEENLEQAREIQQRLLYNHNIQGPTEPEFFGCNQVITFWQPASTVGGDFFDLIKITREGRDYLGICIADVSGKGLPAALLMANFQALLRAFAPGHLSPAELCTELNRVLYLNTTANKYITAVYGILDMESGDFRYCNAGHNKPLLYSGQECSALETTGTVLGLFQEWAFKESCIRLKQGERLLLYTDGATDPENQEHEDYGEERLARIFEAQSKETPQKTIHHMVRDLREFGAGQFNDDVTMILLEPCGGESSS